MKRVLFMLPLLMVACVSSCSKSDTPYLVGQIGKPCTVQFKRDALGGSTTLPVPPTTNAINGAQVSLSGTLRAVEEQAIVLSDSKNTYWVSRDSILLIVSEK